MTDVVVGADGLPDVLRLELPEPPTANLYWRLGRHGRTGRHLYRSAQAEAYKSAVWNRLLTTPVPHATLVYGRPLYGTERLEVTMRWFRNRRAGDLDNRLKVLLDALKHIVYEDDKQIVALHAYRFDPTDQARGIVQLCVSALPAA